MFACEHVLRVFMFMCACICSIFVCENLLKLAGTHRDRAATERSRKGSGVLRRAAVPAGTAAGALTFNLSSHIILPDLLFAGPAPIVQSYSKPKEHRANPQNNTFYINATRVGSQVPSERRQRLGQPARCVQRGDLSPLPGPPPRGLSLCLPRMR